MSGKAETKKAPETQAPTEKVDGRKNRKLTQAHKDAMESGRKRNARIRANVAEAVEHTPDALTRPSVWKDLDPKTADKVIAAIQKVQDQRKQSTIAHLKTELAKLEGIEG